MVRKDEEEVRQAIFDLECDKAPGPDGFPMAFFQRLWKETKDEILTFLKEIHLRGKLSRNLYESFIALIPKKLDAENIKDFRPITLIGIVYKILAKVLVGRLKKVLPTIIFHSQGAFVHDRQIHGVLVANECIHSTFKDKSSGLLCKLDWEKAYDRIDWGFLSYMLRRMGFGNKWIARIECVSYVWFSILINEAPKGFFLAQRCLRQGDPLSPSFSLSSVRYLVRC